MEVVGEEERGWGGHLRGTKSGRKGRERDVIHDPDGGWLAVGSSRGLGLSVNVTGMLGKNSLGKQGRSPL